MKKQETPTLGGRPLTEAEARRALDALRGFVVAANACPVCGKRGTGGELCDKCAKDTRR